MYKTARMYPAAIQTGTRVLYLRLVGWFCCWFGRFARFPGSWRENDPTAVKILPEMVEKSADALGASAFFEKCLSFWPVHDRAAADDEGPVGWTAAVIHGSLHASLMSPEVVNRQKRQKLSS